MSLLSLSSRLLAVLFLSISLVPNLFAQFVWEQIPVTPEIDREYFEYTSLEITHDKTAAYLTRGNYLARSIDTANTWLILDSLTYELKIKRLTAPDSVNLYALSSLNRILTSHNGGRDWREILTQPPELLYNDIHFIDKDNGIAVGGSGTIVLLTDGGNSWKTINTHQGYSLGACTGFTGGKYLAFDYFSGKVFRSFNYGLQWDTIYAFDPFINGKRERFPSAIYFRDSLHGYIVGAMRLHLSTAAPLIIRTTDGGATWNSVVESSADGQRELLAITFLTDQLGIAGGNESRSQVLVTKDGGATWQTDYVQIKNFPPGDRRVNQLLALNSTTLIADVGLLVKGTLDKVSTVFNESTNEHISIHPNPAHNYITVSSISDLHSIVVHDALGRAVVTESLNVNSRIDISNLPPGAYSVMARSDDDRQSLRLIKY